MNELDAPQIWERRVKLEETQEESCGLFVLDVDGLNGGGSEEASVLEQFLHCLSQLAINSSLVVVVCEPIMTATPYQYSCSARQVLVRHHHATSYTGWQCCFIFS